MFRVEVELHAGILRRHQLSTLADFVRLPDVIQPKHLQFVDLDRKHLRRYLARKLGAESKKVIAGAEWESASLRQLRRYFSKRGVVNIHRFLTPLPLDTEVHRALRRWARQFKKSLCEKAK